jgi:hypothetical protein
MRGKGITQNNTTETPETQKTKKRHGCLSIWLFLSIAFDLVFVVIYLSGSGFSLSPKGVPNWAMPALVTLLILEIICAVALFLWKKWGFWGFCLVNVIGFFINIGIGVNLLWPTTQIVLRIALLIVVLNIGDEDKGWLQLE